MIREKGDETFFNEMSVQMAAASAFADLLGVHGKYKPIYTSSMTDQELLRFEYEVSQFEGSEEIFLVD